VNKNFEKFRNLPEIVHDGLGDRIRTIQKLFSTGHGVLAHTNPGK